MIVRKVVTLASAAVAIAALGACRDRNVDYDRTGTSEQPYGKTTVTGASVIANTTAVERIVAARCAREAACKNVGADKHFANTDACYQKVKSDMREDLNANDCPRGINQKELTECLESIQKEDCNNPIDTINRLAACRTSDLCLSTR